MIYMKDIMINEPGIDEISGELITKQRPMNERDLTSALHKTADGLASIGWTVIPSHFKAPSLRKWKEPSKEQLLTWAHEDINSGRCNSLNLRLGDSHVCALDCDFYDDVTMKNFMNLLTSEKILPEFYTVCGGKGGKIFFRVKNIPEGKPLPRVLGPQPLVPKKNGALVKYALELKSDVATVFGAYSIPGTLYSEYPGTKFVIYYRPEDLPEIDYLELQHIATMYIATLKSMAVKKYMPIPLAWDEEVEKLKSLIALDELCCLDHLYEYDLYDMIIAAGDEHLLPAVMMFDSVLPEEKIKEVDERFVKTVQYMRDLGYDIDTLRAYAIQVNSFYADFKNWMLTYLQNYGQSYSYSEGVQSIFTKYKLIKDSVDYGAY